MCGIASIYAYHYAAPRADPDELRQIRDQMSARGPDGFGEWYSPDGRVGLGHRRLAIIDLSEKASQPMRDASSGAVIGFNGEIYNYKELRGALEKKGHRFHSQSDTEVLLRLYADKGEAMLADLRGMFAFVIWDPVKRAMLLARDPYGIKPLYYADDGWTMRAASQVQALLASRHVSRVLETAGTAGFLVYGSVPEPYTLYQEIRAVPAGSYVWVNECGPAEAVRYFSLARAYSDVGALPPESVSEDALRARVGRLLLESVRHHLVSDVPVSLFLSSGVDSSVIAGLAKDAGARNLRTLTLSFDDYAGTQADEGMLAEITAKTYGYEHSICRLASEEIQDSLPKILNAMDQPSIDGVNTFLISQIAAKAGFKVVLTGIGGDELFGGYPSFSDIPRSVSLMKIPAAVPFAGKMVRRIIRLVLPDSVPPKAAGAVEYGGTYEGAYLLRRALFMPWELPYLMNREAAAWGLERLDLLRAVKAERPSRTSDPSVTVSCLESAMYLRNQLLRDADWAGMAHSVEIRLPFVDSHLLKQMMPYMAAIQKKGGKKFIAGLPSTPVSPSVVTRKKTGFTVPIERCLSTDERFGFWKEVPYLRRSNCNISRRWAYTVLQSMTHKTRNEQHAATRFSN